MTLDRQTAEKICEALGMSVPGEPLPIEPHGLDLRLEEATARMAVVAGYHGDADYWELWLKLVAAAKASPEDALALLSHDQAYWLAQWSFLHERESLGMASYERHLRLTGEPGNVIANNPFANFVYFAQALISREPERALRAFRPVRELCGAHASDEVLLATLRFVAQDLDAEDLHRVVERFRRSRDQKVQAARILALEALGDRAGVAGALALLSRASVFSRSLRRVMLERLGGSFAAAIEQDPPPVKAAPRVAGMVAMRGIRKSGHRFAPDLRPGPPCPGCQRLQRIWFSFDLTKVRGLAQRLASWPHRRFDVPACFDCGAWMVEHHYRIDREGRIELEGADPVTAEMARPLGDESMRPVEPQHVRLVKAPRDLDEFPLDGHCQVGGNPAWIQDPLQVVCGRCEGETTFVFRFAAPNEFAGSPMVAGEGGALYYFACSKCARFTQLAQWT